MVFSHFNTAWLSKILFWKKIKSRDRSPVQSNNTNSKYLQDSKQVASTRDKVTTHTACTYKTWDRSPVHVIKLQHTQHVPTIPGTGRQYTWQSYNTHGMYLQDPRQVASTRDKITTHTACIYLQDLRQVASTRDKVTIHTACTYKARDESPVHVTKLQHTHSMYLQDPRQIARTCD